MPLHPYFPADVNVTPTKRTGPQSGTDGRNSAAPLSLRSDADQRPQEPPFPYDPFIQPERIT